MYYLICTVNPTQKCIHCLAFVENHNELFKAKTIASFSYFRSFKANNYLNFEMYCGIICNYGLLFSIGNLKLHNVIKSLDENKHA